VSDARISGHLRDFVKLHPEVEGVLQHVGLRTWDLVLVDASGRWIRDEFPSEAAARAAADRLGIRLDGSGSDPRILRRMNARDHWSTPDGQRRAL
jgi:hypothetical protein